MAHHEPLSVVERQRITETVTEFLRTQGLSPTSLAKRVGVAQPFVWNVANGNFQKMTPRLRRLVQYIHMKTGTADPGVDGVRDAIDRFVASGGDLLMLRSSIDMLTAALATEHKF
ncbi:MULTISPECIES: hypothetical protein [unclassified Bosea (in: a-proteobacteria)]|uniref:hypothetical protein n=1 Tax=unclassified Bosea (in: a-proteobacteria) TaxID=2653178 RepID=UPI000F7FA0B7|nr:MULTISPECIES: hypothetical protein [unclassified Bosea (in: a-proteobacteria)]